MDWSPPVQLDPGSPSQFSGGSGIDCAGEGFCVATGEEGKILVSTDPTGGSAAWREVTIEEASAGKLTSISCPSASFCAAVDDAGHLLTSTEPDGDATTWSSAAIDAGHEIISVSCSSADFCAAVDDAGQVLVSGEPDGGAASWSAGTVVMGEPKQISCSSTSLCALAYDRSNVYQEPPAVLVSTDPLAGASSWTDAGLDLGDRGQAFGVSCPSDDFCGFAYSGGILVSGDPTGGGSTWHLTHSSSEGLPAGEEDSYLEGLGISCSSADFCVAQLTMAARRSFAPPEPKLVISSQPAGPGSWTVQTMSQEWAEWPFGRAGMVCTDSTFCATVASSGSISTSTEPAGGAEAWDIAVTGSVGPTLTSVACPARTFCAATGTLGRLYTSTDPADPNSWTATRLAERVESVTCASPTWCTVGAAGTGGPMVMHATEPAAGAAAWGAVSRPTGRALTCPEPGFCAQLADYDKVLASDDPLGGAGEWVTTEMNLPDERLGRARLFALSCPSAALCVTGGDSNGRFLTSADPTSGRSSWVSAPVGANESNGPGPVINPAITGIDCPQMSFCAATASGGIDITTAPLVSNAWMFSRVPGISFRGPISCVEDGSLCVGVDENGNALTARLPLPAAPLPFELSHPVAVEPIYEGEGLRDVSCAVDGSLCAVVSDDGQVIVGTRHHGLLSFLGALLGKQGAAVSSGGRRARTRCGRLLRIRAVRAARASSCRWGRG